MLTDDEILLMARSDPNGVALSTMLRDDVVVRNFLDALTGLMRAAIQAALAAAPQGEWVMVPREPTEAMCKAGWTPEDPTPAGIWALMIYAAPPAPAATQGEPAEVYNPWRESLENCISGDNYLRASEYRDLIEDLDDLYRLRAAAPPAPAAQPSNKEPSNG